MVNNPNPPLPAPHKRRHCLSSDVGDSFDPPSWLAFCRQNRLCSVCTLLAAQSFRSFKTEGRYSCGCRAYDFAFVNFICKSGERLKDVSGSCPFCLSLWRTNAFMWRHEGGHLPWSPRSWLLFLSCKWQCGRPFVPVGSSSSNSTSLGSNICIRKNKLCLYWAWTNFFLMLSPEQQGYTSLHRLWNHTSSRADLRFCVERMYIVSMQMLHPLLWRIGASVKMITCSESWNWHPTDPEGPRCLSCVSLLRGLYPVFSTRPGLFRAYSY